MFHYLLYWCFIVIVFCCQGCSFGSKNTNSQINTVETGIVNNCAVMRMQLEKTNNADEKIDVLAITEIDDTNPISQQELDGFSWNGKNISDVIGKFGTPVTFLSFSKDKSMMKILCYRFFHEGDIGNNDLMLFFTSKNDVIIGCRVMKKNTIDINNKDLFLNTELVFSKLNQ